MKTLILLLMTSALPLSSFAQLTELRKAFFNAKNDAGIQQFYKSATEAKTTSVTISAYKGAASAMYAGQVSGVSNKLDYFWKGKGKLEASVKQEPGNAEVRFLRFAIQCEAPMILNYSGQIKGDANVIIDYLEKNPGEQKTDFWKKAMAFMVKSGELTAGQLKVINKFND